MNISGGRAALAQTLLVSLATLTAVVALAGVLAYWTWVWFAPAAVARVGADAGPASRSDLAQGLFGASAANGVAAAPTAISIRLLGVAAAEGAQRGYAVVQLEGRQILAVREGEELAPGILLAEVHTDHVILSRNGARESLSFPERGAQSRDPAALAQPGAATPALPKVRD